jgi:hypothetical protein
MAGEIFSVVFLLVIVAVFGGLVYLEVKTLRSWQRAWRIPASLPGLALAYVILRIVVDVWHDPTTHNLWPFELLIWSVGGMAFLGLLLLIRKVLR